MANNEKRNALIELSKIAKMRQEEDLEGMSINEILVEVFYTDKENFEFNTFKQWKQKGMNIKKGATAFLVWGSKRKNKEVQAEPVSEDEKTFEFFPVCYLFSNNQVQPQSND